MSTLTRPALPGDLPAIARLAFELWPDSPLDDHADHMAAILSGSPPSTLPMALFVAEVDGRISGFIEVGLRSHADGCDPARPVGFIEGWAVDASLRRRAVGRALMDTAEAWARSKGATELGSDTWIDHQDSQAAHAALGFEVVDRCVHFRKPIGRGPSSQG